MNDNIITYVRIKDTGTQPDVGKGCVRVGGRVYHADAVLHGADQEALFRSVQSRILEKCVRGYNCSVFAYGQTGSGKTYTIEGSAKSPGLVQRSLAFLHGIYPSIRVSFIEIYNENTVDLLDPERPISIRDDPQDGITVDNLSIHSVRSLEESLGLYERGISNRKRTATLMNENSSRSHSIFSMLLEHRDGSIVKKSRLCFVDLAGSEKCREGEAERVKEACNINKSLLCLGKIVHKLSTNDRWHISYRDSRLTFLLKDSLGGNCKLAIIGNVNLDYPADTINTLEFLKRSKMITNNPSINYDTAQSSVEELTESLRAMDAENQRLREAIAALTLEQEQGAKHSVRFSVRRLKAEVGGLQAQCARLKELCRGMATDRFDGNRELLASINERLLLLSEARKENISNLMVKRPRMP